MIDNCKPIGTFVVLLLLLISPPLSHSTQLAISTVEQIENEFRAVPCKDDDRLGAVKALLERMGAASSEITIGKREGVDNVIVSKQGLSNEKVVVEAHYDKVSDGCGAIDNWSGIVTLAHLYRALKNVRLSKTIVFVAFGKEEKGLAGSKAFVKAIAKKEIGQYCAMVNIDSLGLGAPQVAHNMSSRNWRSLLLDLPEK